MTTFRFLVNDFGADDTIAMTNGIAGVELWAFKQL
jgi:hypothetical protein